MKRLLLLSPLLAVIHLLSVFPGFGASPGATGLLVFERSEPNKNGSPGERDVWIQDAQGSEVRLTDAPGDDQDAVFSPADRNLIAFGSQGGNAGGDLDLWLMGSDGTNKRKLLELDGHEGVPSWSPDGRSLVFARVPLDASSNETDLYTVDVQAPTPVATALVTEPGKQDWPAWSPAGDLIAYEGTVQGKGKGSTASAIYVFSLTSRTSKPLTAAEIAGRTPQWTPDGSRIVFTGRSTGPGSATVVYSMMADGSDLKVVTGRSLYAPEISPDGTYLVFRAYNSSSKSWDLGRLMLRGDGVADDATFTWLTSTSQYESQPHYQPLTSTNGPPPTVSPSASPCLIVPPVC